MSETKLSKAEEIIAKLSPHRYPLEWVEHVSKMNVHQRIHGATADLGPLQKDGYAKMTNEGGFKYHGHAEITAHVKAALSKWQLLATTNVIEEQHEPVEIGKYKNPGWLTTVRVLFRIASIDNPADYVESVHVGYGIDTGDKGSGKAVTYATKYAMMKQFLISDGEEPDNELFDPDRAREEEPTTPKANQQSNGRQSAARKALDKAENGAGYKSVDRMTNGEILAQIFKEVEIMGYDRQVVRDYLSEHDKAKTPSDIPKARLISIWQDMRAKANALESARRMVSNSRDPENSEAMLAAVMEGRSIFEVRVQDLHGLMQRLDEMEAAV